MKFFMAQNEDGELRIASSSDDKTMDNDGWYKVKSASNFKEIDNSKEPESEESKLQIPRGSITQLIIPYWVDSRGQEHFPNCYFLQGSSTIHFFDNISEIFPISYNDDNIKIKEVYRTIFLNKNQSYRLQYIDYSDEINITSLINYQPNQSIRYFNKITIADETNTDNLNNVLLEQDLFFQLKINPQGTNSKKIQFDIKIIGFKNFKDDDKETELASERLFYIVTDKADMGKEITFSKKFSISNLIDLSSTSFSKITKIIVEKNTSITTDDRSYLISFSCYLPYFTWVDATLQVKHFPGAYLEG